MKPTSPDYPISKALILILMSALVLIARTIYVILRPKSWKFYKMNPPN